MNPLEDLFLQYFEILPDKSGFRCKLDGEIIIPDDLEIQRAEGKTATDGGEKSPSSFNQRGMIYDGRSKANL